MVQPKNAKIDGTEPEAAADPARVLAAERSPDLETDDIPPPIKPGLRVRLLHLLPELENVASTEADSSGASAVAHGDWAPHVAAIRDLLYSHQVIYPFDWVRWVEGPTGQAMLTSTDAIGRADLASVRRMLTAHVRQDRFSDGHLATVAGTPPFFALLRRLVSLLGPGEKGRSGARRRSIAR